MTAFAVPRRGGLAGAAALLALPVLPAAAQAAAPAIRVMMAPGCGCCTAWADILRQNGVAVGIALRDQDNLQRIKRASGIPEAMASCHTARIGAYVIEGHVPAAEIRRLLLERPVAVGLAVPGMPWGSPGMGPDTEREAYDVRLIHRDGSTTVFSRYTAA